MNFVLPRRIRSGTTTSAETVTTVFADRYVSSSYQTLCNTTYVALLGSSITGFV